MFGLGCTAYIVKLISQGGTRELQQKAWEVISQNNYHAKPDLIDYICLLLKSWGTMLQKVVWPVNLAPEYAIPTPETFFEFSIILAILIIIAVTIALFHSGKQQNSNVFFCTHLVSSFLVAGIESLAHCHTCGGPILLCNSSWFDFFVSASDKKSL